MSHCIRMVLAAALLAACRPGLLRAEEPPAPPDAAWQRLKAGNARFAADKPDVKDIGAGRRAELAKGQAPIAVVLSCADSRVGPEKVFDQGLGDLFVLRVAGNVADPDMLGSMEYAVVKLNVPLIVVLGHEDCGAVQAAVDGAKLSGNLGKLIEQVHVGDDLPKEEGAAVSAAARANVLYQAALATQKSDVLRDFVKSGRVRIVAGVYSLTTGEVRWLAARDK